MDQITKKIIKITPKPEEFLPQKSVCTEPGCGMVFGNSSNFHMHKARHHLKKNLVKAEEPNPNEISIKQYFCPMENCIYNQSTENPKHFTLFRYLRQHYQVHMPKIFKCDKCQQSFVSKNAKELHTEKYCGLKFKCKDCAWLYSSRQALLTHCKRKKHTFDEPQQEPDKQIKSSSKKSSSKLNARRKAVRNSVPPAVLIKASEPEPEPVVVIFYPYMPVETQNQGAQTDRIQLPSYQTIARKRYQTQSEENVATVAGEEIVKTENDSSVSINNNNSPLNFPSTVKRKTNLDFIIDDDDDETPATTTNSAENLNHLNYVEDDSISTCFIDQFANSSSYCDIETQTEFPTSATILDQMLYSNMCTQTCDDILSEFGLADIQTQTNWPNSCTTSNLRTTALTEQNQIDYNDLFISTETQTSFSHPMFQSNDPTSTANGSIAGTAGITQHTQTCDALLGGLFAGRENDLLPNFHSAYTQT